MALKVLLGEVPVTTPAEVKAMGTLFYEVARLEAGQPTSISHETRETLEAQAKAIVAKLRERGDSATDASDAG